ncbi:hypothetical protein [Brevundimonas naejangsanensis]|uniref:AbiTii domain-containing protein n=1 Tax=Brevundimonas naejangsanensis TaxID=588932 RepID=UPI003CFCC509
MTGLVEQLANDAAHGDVSVSQLLRRAKLIASRLEVASVEQWIEHELSGYPNELEIPRYRILPGIPQGHWAHHGWRNLKLGPDERMNAAYSLVFFNGSVTDVEAHVEGDEGVRLSLPEFLEVAVVQQHHGMDKAAVFVGRGKLHDILGAVRNRIMDWALQLERAGVSGEGKGFDDDDRKVAKAVTYNFYGDNARLNQDSTDSSTNVVVNGDIWGDLRARIAQGVEPIETRDAMLRAVDDMHATKNTSAFLAAYQKLIGLAADHIQVIQWALPGLSIYLSAQ